ncbi:helix-turn-helix transcriptional regulator [Burkholderia guangdongensis]|uniref:helix-turn-helix transcriptional regulator n=1 Tax=Burkholderia guangdongensis TaxID=1792500 RepID=UPI0015CDC70F|nr:helix-turn-helix transcriptional regulator [Burkholderia guangdongensis]
MRILQPDPLGQANYLIGVRPRTLGAAMQAVGTTAFVAALAEFIHENIVVESVHLERWRADPQSATGFVIEWLGSWSEQDPDVCKLMDIFYQDYCHSDPLFLTARGTSGTLLLQRHVAGLAAGDFRRLFFDEPRISQECMLVHGNAQVQFAIGLARSVEQPAYSTDELFHLRQMADLLFPLFEMHTRLCAARRIAVESSHAPSLGGFDARLARQDVRLSRREYEICKLMLSGRSVPEAASHLDIKFSTAESYVKRAFVKLGVHTRRELFDWALVSG